MRENQELGQGWMIKVHLLHKVTHSRLGEVAVSPNTQKQTQIVEQDEETEEFVPNEGTR